jgi:hypothetical protein
LEQWCLCGCIEKLPKEENKNTGARAGVFIISAR